MGIPIEDRIGQKFNRLTVLSVFSKGYKNSDGKQIQARLLVQCDCGTVKDMAASNVTSGGVKGCGCHTIRPVTHHGMHKDPLYKTWDSLRSRILDVKNKDFHNYGGRNLKMEPEWIDSFPAFREWVLENLGPKPSPELSLDRVKNHLGYIKGNLRWATVIEQQNNRRSNKMLTFQGITANMKQHCDMLGLAYSAVKMRLGAMGWTVEEALGTPTNGDHAYRRPKVEEPQAA